MNTDTILATIEAMRDNCARCRRIYDDGTIDKTRLLAEEMAYDTVLALFRDDEYAEKMYRIYND